MYEYVIQLSNFWKYKIPSRLITFINKINTNIGWILDENLCKTHEVF